jgi:aminoglycoside phosphotransferase family enzyme/predicted kinase
MSGSGGMAADATRDSWPRGLLHPEAYPHAVGAVRLVETHISWVFLTGPFAYKLKKPVDLGFLDFSTTERRRRSCEEEVRLNRRFAPSIYLDVVPVTGEPAAPRVDGPGAPIDWAVRLVQFDEANRLDRLVADGRAGEEAFAALARDLSAIQGGLPIAPDQAGFGTVERVRDAMRTTLDHLFRLRPADTARIGAIAEWFERELSRRSDSILRRRSRGRVRECHGDLHLANLVRHEGRIVPFDAIEFNESLRWIDVASDIAFLAMDLRARGRTDLAAVLVSGWIEAADDHSAAEVLPLFGVYRAAVRAAVAAIRDEQATRAAAPDPVPPDPDAREHGTASAGSESTRYLAVAESLMRPPRRILLATCGVSGSGKSTVAAALVREQGAIRLRSDVERKRLAGLDPTDRPSVADREALYGEEMTRRTYRRLAELAGRLLAAGASVVVDAACTRRWQRGLIAEAAAHASADLEWLVSEVPAEVAERRVRDRAARGDDPSDASVEILREQRRSFEPIALEEFPPGHAPGAITIRPVG